MAHNSEIRNQLFDQFSRSILANGWRDFSCAEVATEAGIEIKLAFVEFPSRYAYVTELIRRIDEAMLDAYDKDMGDETARDRLFDVMMARFDAMQDYRNLIIALTKSTRQDPILSLHLMTLSRLTTDRFMDISRISPVGIRGIVRSKGALAAYARTFAVWLKDESEDLAKTMASLDKFLKRGEQALRRAERLACLLPGMGGKCSSADRKATGDVAGEDGEPSVIVTPAVDEGGMAPMPS